MDNYEPLEYYFDIKDSADAQFNNIQYMYIGKNESMSDGFIGCVSRVEFDDIYPLKLLFQENGPGNIKSIGCKSWWGDFWFIIFVMVNIEFNSSFAFCSTATLTEDFCGVEPITHPPILVETRPPPLVDPYKVEKAYNRFDSILWGSKLISHL